MAASLIVLIVGLQLSDKPCPNSMEFNRTGGVAGVDERIIVRADGSFAVMDHDAVIREGRITDEQWAELSTFGKVMPEYSAPVGEEAGGSDIRREGICVLGRMASWTDLSKEVPVQPKELARRLAELTSGKQVVATVAELDLTLRKKDPPDLMITAVAEAPHPGWKEPILSRHLYVSPPRDGVWAYDFLATEGSSLLPAVTRLEADTTWPNYEQKNVKGIRVLGKGNGVMEKRLD